MFCIFKLSLRNTSLSRFSSVKLSLLFTIFPADENNLSVSMLVGGAVRYNLNNEPRAIFTLLRHFVIIRLIFSFLLNRRRKWFSTILLCLIPYAYLDILIMYDDEKWLFPIRRVSTFQDCRITPREGWEKWCLKSCPNLSGATCIYT